MAAGDVTITRGVGTREDFITVTQFTLDAAVTLTTDGDIGTLAVTNANTGASETLAALSTTTYPLLIIRALAVTGGNALSITVTYSDTTTSPFSLSLPTSNVYATGIFTLTAGKTLSSIKYFSSGAPLTFKIDFGYFFKETLTLPAASQPLQLSLTRRIADLQIPTREGSVIEDLGSPSPLVEVGGTLITTTSPNNYTGDQWWDVLVGTWLEANWQWFTSDRVAYKYQIVELSNTQNPGRVGYYDFKLRLKKVDIVTASAQTFSSNTGSGAIQ